MSDEFKEESIPLVAVNEDGIWEITVEGINFLSSLKNEKICILSLTGPSKSGKSFLANTIQKRTSGFERNPTKGLWIWGRPIPLENNLKLLIIDSQGLDVSDSDANQKLFILCIWLSTCWIYNTKGEITNDTITSFVNYTDITNKINIKPETNAKLTTFELLSEYSPNLIWAIQNYSQDSKSANEYLEEWLNKTAKSAAAKSLFQQRSCFYLPTPTQNVADLDKEEISNLTPEYTTAIEQWYTTISSTIKSKNINGIEIDGDALFGILQNYLDSINNDENPVISSAWENVLLSKAKNISEKNFENFKNEINGKLQNKYPWSYTEIYKIFFEIQDKETNNFCKSVQSTLNSKQTGDYWNKLYERMRSELETIFETNKEYYDEWFDVEYKEIEKWLTGNDLTKIEDVKGFVATYTTNFQTGMTKFLDIPNSEFCKNLIGVLLKIFQDFVITKWLKLSDSINDMYSSFSKECWTNIETLNASIKRLNEQWSSEKKILDDKTKEKSELNRTYLELVAKFDSLTRDIKTKEKEYENNCNIWNQKYQKMETYYANQLKDKETANSALESKIEKLNKDIIEVNKENSTKVNELNRDNMKLHVEIERWKGQEKKGKGDVYDNKNLNWQSLFKSIQNTFMEFKESVDKLDRENENVFKIKYLELSTKEIESKSRNWIEEIRLFREDQIKAMNESYEKNIKKWNDEVEELRFELTKANYNLNEQTQLKETYVSKYNDMNKQLEVSSDIISSKDKIINTQAETIGMWENNITENKKIREDLEFNLNKNIVNFKMKEDELETVMLIIEALCCRKKEKYDKAMMKLSNETQNNIHNIVKAYKVFK